MKTLISILNFLIILFLVLSAGAAGGLALALPRPVPVEPWDYGILSILNALLFSGLLFAVIAALAGFASTVLAFIFKSWFRALISICITVAASALWIYFLECAL